MKEQEPTFKVGDAVRALASCGRITKGNVYYVAAVEQYAGWLGLAKEPNGSRIDDWSSGNFEPADALRKRLKPGDQLEVMGGSFGHRVGDVIEVKSATKWDNGDVVVHADDGNDLVHINAVRLHSAALPAGPKLTPADPVTAPQHYRAPGLEVECMDVIQALGLSFPLGSALKYIWRHQSKGNPLQDLKKARENLDRAIKDLEARPPQNDPAAKGDA